MSPDPNGPSTAVVTGAANGIGEAIARQLASAGTTVIGVDRDELGLEHLQAELGERLVPIAGDVTSADTHERAAAAAEHAGVLRGWVNNAGVDWAGPAQHATVDHIEQGLRLLLASAMYGGAVAVRGMLASGGGSVVNVASIQGTHAFPGYYVYGAAKAALIMAAKSIAVDYAPFGIRANAVLPGCIETPMTIAGLPAGVDRAEALRREGELAPMLRVGQADEVADVVTYLLSDAATYVTGTEVVVDGGASARCFPYPSLER